MIVPSGDPAIDATAPCADPAVEAAKRATAPHAVSPFVGPGRYALYGAREALAPLRELHTRRQKMHNAICDECRTYWPCATAKLIYTREELEESYDHISPEATPSQDQEE